MDVFPFPEGSVKGYDGNGQFVMVLDETIFHPQGGGQPNDEGSITHKDNQENKFIIKNLCIKDDVIWHIGQFEPADCHVAFVKDS